MPEVEVKTFTTTVKTAQAAAQVHRPPLPLYILRTNTYVLSLKEL
jgi:hypothetical protein